MSRVGNSSDPRVQRTRQLLLEAFMALVQEKHTIHSISIQEIARRATVNRATFYAHFEDKYALMADWSREKFQRGLVCQFPASSTLQRETLHRLILAVFDFMALSRQYSRPSNRQFEQKGRGPTALLPGPLRGARVLRSLPCHPPAFLKQEYSF